MARKKIELFITINNEHEFKTALIQNKDKLICAEIYCEFAGVCTALDRLLTKLKMMVEDGVLELYRVPADYVEDLSRLRGNSEPFYMFIVGGRVTRVFRGVHSVRFEEVFKQELNWYQQEKNGLILERPTYSINEATPEEMDWLEARAAEKNEELKSLKVRQEERQAVRKMHRAELMAPYLKDLDFVLYWPHATYAHPELYERWDENGLVMIAREEFYLTREQALDVLYYGDALINEASMHALLSGPALAICLRSLNPVHVVSLVRKILYEDDRSPPIKETEKNRSTTILPMSADQYYRSFSPTKEKILEQRREKRIQEKIKNKENKARHLAERQRLAYQARTEAIEHKRAAKEQEKLDLLKAGKLAELEMLKSEPADDEDVDIEIPEEQSYVSEESDLEEDPDEYFPPAGLPVPGFYSPPNDIAKANGLAILFPKLVQTMVQPQEEILPPHVLVMIHINKRHKVVANMGPFKYGFIHMGIFNATTPYNAKHIAYSVKQFESMGEVENMDNLKLCFMVSTRVDVPLLQLMDFAPIHVSRDAVAGEDECAAMFCVNYGDDYPEFEDFEFPEEEQG